MKLRPWVLLVLLQGAAAAEPAAQPDPPGSPVDPGEFSSVKAVPGVSSALIAGDSERAQKGGAGLLADGIAFQAPLRPSGQPPTGAVSAAGAVRSAFPYDPSAYAAQESDEEPSSSSVMVMEPISVPGTRLRAMAEAIDAAEEFREASAFHLATGGRLGTVPMGDYDVDLGVWRHESLAAYDPHLGVPKLVVDLVRIKW